MRLTYEQVTDTMQKKLTAYGTPDDQADLVSKQIARNSLEGVYTHGINRFPRLIYNIKAGIVKPGNTPKLMHSFQLNNFSLICANAGMRLHAGSSLWENRF